MDQCGSTSLENSCLPSTIVLPGLNPGGAVTDCVVAAYATTATPVRQRRPRPREVQALRFVCH